MHDPSLLFHVEHDPSEKRNIADKHPDVVKELLELMKEHQRNLVAESMPSSEKLNFVPDGQGCPRRLEQQRGMHNNVSDALLTPE